MQRGFAMAAAVAWAAAGCTTTAGFRMSQVDQHGAAIAGRVIIFYNGRNYNEHCQAMFSGQLIDLAQDGIVLLPVEPGWKSLEQIQCKDGSLQHAKIRGAHFYARPGRRMTDFGDVMITWDTSGGPKVTDGLGLMGAVLDAGDDGVATIRVGAPYAEVRNAFRRQTGIDGTWDVSVMSQPRYRHMEPVRPALAEAGDPATPPVSRPPRFFCTSTPPEGRIDGYCERDLTRCQRIRTALGARFGACVPAESAWCFTTDGKLRCLETASACDSVRGREQRADACGEQY